MPGSATGGTVGDLGSDALDSAASPLAFAVEAFGTDVCVTPSDSSAIGEAIASRHRLVM